MRRSFCPLILLAATSCGVNHTGSFCGDGMTQPMCEDVKKPKGCTSTTFRARTGGGCCDYVDCDADPFPIPK